MNAHIDHNLVIAYAAGYMLKVLKNKKEGSAFKQEFAAIRHGNYHQFLTLVDGEIPFMIIYDEGEIRDNITSIEHECDFAGLLASGQSLKEFKAKCESHYGKINDSDFTDELYRKLVVFEIAIRMHVNNRNLISPGDTLEQVINKLPNIFPLSPEELETLHSGRKFLNQIKHNKANSDSWKLNASQFELAYSILGKHGIKIV